MHSLDIIVFIGLLLGMRGGIRVGLRIRSNTIKVILGLQHTGVTLSRAIKGRKLL